MRMGVYARPLSVMGGIREFILSMTQSLIKIMDSKDKLYIFHNQTEKYFETPEKTHVREILLKSKNRIICDFLLFPILSRKFHLDVIWFPKNVLPFFVQSRSIVTIHDLAYFLPSLNAYPVIDTQYMTRMIRSTCKRADAVIAVSSHTKTDLISLLNMDAEKVNVIYEAVNREKFQVIDDKNRLEKVREKYELGEKIILFTGSISPRKNLIRLIQAFQMIEDLLPHDLVITGDKGWKNTNDHLLINRHRRIKKIGFVPENEITCLYNLADIYVYPSLYEGFGLPVLEAQACGVPVIASNVTSIPEVGKDSVCYVNPTSVHSLAEAILKVASDRKYRNFLIQKGFKNILNFNWDNGARALLKACAEIMGK
jgi:glycosyltransferase involved in cell wall biosynthesis